MRQLYEQIRTHAGALGIGASWTVLPAASPPWQPSGLRLARGQAYTLLADGVIRWSDRHPHLHAGPGFHLWARVHPGGRIVNVTRQSGSFVADVSGELEFGIYLGLWRDAFGTLDTPRQAYARLRGELGVIALAWPRDARSGLEDLSLRVAHPSLATEIARLARAVALPEGWNYLLETGTTDIFHDCVRPGAACICVDADDDQGIIRKAVDWSLTADTELAWRWRLDRHPSTVREDSSTSHDYVSVAAEFDNGRDLTWIWSSSLPRDYHFACPIRAWQARETHWVVRNGEDVRDQWHGERRRVRADAARAMGPPPARIVAIWLIAVATFHHGIARARFEDIVLSDGERRLEVL